MANLNDSSANPEANSAPSAGLEGVSARGGQQPQYHRQYYQDDPRMKSPALATMLSLMPGLGQVYIGYYQQGFMHILIVASLIALLSRGAGSLEPLFGLFLAFFWLFNLVDAGRRAHYYNQAIILEAPLGKMDGFQLPSRQGGLFAGIALIVLGALSLAHIRFGLSLYWLERWWPAALVLLGGYLVYQSWKSRKEA